MLPVKVRQKPALEHGLVRDALEFVLAGSFESLYDKGRVQIGAIRVIGARLLISRFFTPWEFKRRNS